MTIISNNISLRVNLCFKISPKVPTITQKIKTFKLYNKSYLVVALELIVMNNYCQLAEKKVSRLIS